MEKRPGNADTAQSHHSGGASTPVGAGAAAIPPEGGAPEPGRGTSQVGGVEASRSTDRLKAELRTLIPPEGGTPEPDRQRNAGKAWARLGLCAILLAYFLIVTYSSSRLSPAADEGAHVRTGMTLMTREAFVDVQKAWWTKLDLVHPILDIGPALFARAAGQSPDYRAAITTPFARLRAARWFNHLAGALLLIGVYLWAGRLWGRLGGLLSTLFLACTPLFLAHSSIVSSDLYMALGGTAAAWAIWREYLDRPRPLAGFGWPFWRSSLLVGGLAGFAALCKLNNIIFVPILGLGALAGAWRSRRADEPAGQWVVRGLAAGAVAGGLALLIAAAAYEATHATRFPVLVFARRVFLPVGQPLLMSLSVAKNLHKIQPLVYYLGELVPPRPLHYLFSFLTKMPLPLLALLPGAAAATALIARRHPARRLTVLYLWGLFAGLWAVYTTRHIFMGLRHLLPLLALLAVLAGSLAQLPRFLSPGLALGCGHVIRICLILAALDAAAATPWQLSYFNHFIFRGKMIAVDSEGDWGEGLLALRDWQAKNAPHDPLWLAYFGASDPADFGVKYHGLYAPYSYAVEDPAGRARRFPGDFAGAVVAISKTHLAGTCIAGVGGDPAYYRPWFLRQPDKVVGGTICIYDLRSRK